MNSLFSQTQPQRLDPMQVMQAVRSYQGSPEQAKAEFCNQVAAMGMTPSQLNSLLDQVDGQMSMMRSMGLPMV